jgi:hypothetical protein
MKIYKFKEDLSKEQKTKQVEKLLNITSITDEGVKYRHIYRVLKMLGLNRPSCKRRMVEDYDCSDTDLIDNEIEVTDGLETRELETNSPFVDIYCTNHIYDYIKPEDDLILHEDKNGNKKYIKIEELQYYYFRLNKRLFDSGGYNAGTARNYFLSDGFKEEYKLKTGRNFNPHKIALFNRILHKYNLINVYKVKKKPNLYVIGENNPCYWFEGVMETNHLETIKKLIAGNNYRTVNLTPKDKRIQQLEQTSTKQTEEIISLKKELDIIKRISNNSDSMQADYIFTLEQNTELIKEVSRLKKQQEHIGKWNIAYKPVAIYNFDEKFKEYLKSGSTRKTVHVPVKTEYPEERSDSLKELREIVNRFGTQVHS